MFYLNNILSERPGTKDALGSAEPPLNHHYVINVNKPSAGASNQECDPSTGLCDFFDNQFWNHPNHP